MRKISIRVLESFPLALPRRLQSSIFCFFFSLFSLIHFLYKIIFLFIIQIFSNGFGCKLHFFTFHFSLLIHFLNKIIFPFILFSMPLPESCNFRCLLFTFLSCCTIFALPIICPPFFFLIYTFHIIRSFFKHQICAAYCHALQYYCLHLIFKFALPLIFPFFLDFSSSLILKLLFFVT